MNPPASQPSSSSPPNAVAASDLLAHFEQKFAAILSPRRPLERLAEAASSIKDGEEVFIRHWVDVSSRTNLELAYHIAALTANALTRFGQRGTRQWLLDALAIYDREGLYPAVRALEALDEYAIKRRQSAVQVSFNEVTAHLQHFLRGLSGRDLKLTGAERAYTDTETIFLPTSLSRFPSREENLRLYLAMTVLLWAQTAFGTFKRTDPNAPTLSERLQRYPNPARAEAMFQRVETLRLLAVVSRELPGLHRQIIGMQEQLPAQDTTWAALRNRLEAPDATVETSFEVLDILLERGLEPGSYAFEAGFELADAERVMRARHQREAAILAAELEGMIADNSAENDGTDEAADLGDSPPSTGSHNQQSDGSTALPGNLQQHLASMLQDFDTLPDFNAFETAGEEQEPGEAPDDMPLPDTDALPGQVQYFDEWDFARQAYRADWCRVIEREVATPTLDFRSQVVDRYPHLVKAIHRIFDAMRDAPEVLKKQTDGEDIDLDAALAAEVDRRAGQEISERMYLRRNHAARSVAVMILVDVSGSTKGWINQAERESLILICEALDRLDDRYALVAFSGMTRERCEVFPLKLFDETNSEQVQARIGGLQPRYYTRMGAAIRYATQLLSKEIAKHRILLVLSDGKPDDYDGYKGDYGIEDTRKALIEARAVAIRPFCITIDTDAQDYLPHLFGKSGYTLLSDVGKLPVKIADIYRRLSADH